MPHFVRRRLCALFKRRICRFGEIDLSDRIRTGINHFAVRVWHIGAATQRHKPAQAGVIFEAESGGKIVLASGDGTAARQSRALKNGYRKLITAQLGFSFLYDATKEDDWKTGGGEGFSEAVIVGKKCVLFPRPTKKSVYGEEQAGGIIRFCRENGVRCVIVGNGSNLLVADGGIDACVLCFSSACSDIRLVDETTVFAESGGIIFLS